jgi:iron-sulfur cluster repair protein YtfE (RIC family)
MQTHIGTQAIVDDAVGLLLESHGRIRAFTELTARLASAEGASEAEIAEVAVIVRRYFAEAFPLHAQDEEESLLPRLAGRDRQVDAALVTMHREHTSQAGGIAHLVELCAELAASPGRHAALAPELGEVAAQLRAHLATHLAREEEVVFPAMLALVGDGARAEIVRELRARRDHSSR